MLCCHIFNLSHVIPLFQAFLLHSVSNPSCQNFVLFSFVVFAVGCYTSVGLQKDGATNQLEMFDQIEEESIECFMHVKEVYD